jgi:hypothetical protein
MSQNEMMVEMGFQSVGFCCEGAAAGGGLQQAEKTTEAAS